MQPPYGEWYEKGRDSARGVGVFFEAIITAVYSNILKPGDFALDGGANHGVHTGPMSACVGRKGLVAAVEAMPELAATLAAKWKKPGNVRIVQAALGAFEGETDFVFVPQADGYSGRKQQSNIPATALEGVRKLTVAQSTIDHIIAQMVRYDLRFMKLDLEGGEYDALRGAGDAMGRCRPLIVFENGRGRAAELYGYDREQWFALFAQHGYQVFDLFGRPFGPEQWNIEGIPWYFIAAARPVDIEFATQRLPQKIAGLP